MVENNLKDNLEKKILNVDKASVMFIVDDEGVLMYVNIEIVDNIPKNESIHHVLNVTKIEVVDIEPQEVDEPNIMAD